MSDPTDNSSPSPDTTAEPELHGSPSPAPAADGDGRSSHSIAAAQAGSPLRERDPHQDPEADLDDDVRRTRPRLHVPPELLEPEDSSETRVVSVPPRPATGPRGSGPDLSGGFSPHGSPGDRSSELPTPPHGTAMHGLGDGDAPPQEAAPRSPSPSMHEAEQLTDEDRVTHPGDFSRGSEIEDELTNPAAPRPDTPFPPAGRTGFAAPPAPSAPAHVHDEEEHYEPLTPIAGMRVIQLTPRPSDPPNAPLPPGPVPVVVVEPPPDAPTLRRSVLPPAPGAFGTNDPGWTPMAAPVAETEAEQLAEDEIEITETDDAEELPTPGLPPPRSLPPPSSVHRSAPPPAPPGPPPPPPPPPPAAPVAAAPKRKQWFEELFDQDYLRTLRRLTERQLLAEVSFIEERLGLQNGAEILDLGCGNGRHANALAQRGYRVVGLDLSPAMLAVANATPGGPRASFVQGDMRDMTYDAAFDGVVCWGTTFGYFEEEKNAALLVGIRRALRPGGVVLLDIANRDHVAAQQPNLVWFEGTGCVCIDETSVDHITSRLRVKRTMKLEDGRAKENDYSLRLYSLHEIGKLLKDAGFRVVEVSGQTATPGVFFGHTSPRCLVLAERD
jgi:SAM-dependent methyltransferase